MTISQTRPTGANDEPLPNDILVGAQAISAFLYGPEEGKRDTCLRRVYHAISKREIPTFRIGGKLHARKSVIRKRIEAQEESKALVATVA